MKYRIGAHPQLVVTLPDFPEHYHPYPDTEMHALFCGPEAELAALHYTRAMNAEMPGCTCRVICCCGALVGTTNGCETCAEHNVECAPPP